MISFLTPFSSFIYYTIMHSITSATCTCRKAAAAIIILCYSIFHTIMIDGKRCYWCYKTSHYCQRLYDHSEPHHVCLKLKLLLFQLWVVTRLNCWLSSNRAKRMNQNICLIIFSNSVLYFQKDERWNSDVIQQSWK